MREAFDVLLVPRVDGAPAYGSLGWWRTDVVQGLAVVGRAIDGGDLEHAAEIAAEVVASAVGLADAIAEAIDAKRAAH